MTKDISRRELIRLGAGTALALGVPPILSHCGGGASVPPPDRGGTPATVHAVLGDTLGGLCSMAVQSTQALGIARNALLGAKVFIKPNFVGLGIFEGFDPATGECTKPEIVAAVAEQCLLARASKVTIGDGAQGVSWSWETVRFLPGTTFHGTTNLAAAVSYLNTTYGDKVELVCLNEADQWTRVPSSCTKPPLTEGLLVARSFHEADHVISIPVLKAHQWAGLTLSMKCLLGVTPLLPYRVIGEPSRGLLHVSYAETACGGVQNAGIAGCYLDVLRSRKEKGAQDFAIIEASIGLEKNGPHKWDETVPIDLPGSGGVTIDFKKRNRAGKYFMLASTDLAAADSVAARIAGYGPDTLKQLVIAHNLGLGETRKVTLRGASLDDLAIPDWLRADRLEEWGVTASTLTSRSKDPAWTQCLPLNQIIALACPTAAVCLIKWLRGRNGRPQGASHVRVP